METTVLLRTRIPARRMKQAEKALARMGLKPSDAVNLLMAQVALHQRLPFAVTALVETNDDKPLLTKEQVAARWTEAFGEY